MIKISRVTRACVPSCQLDAQCLPRWQGLSSQAAFYLRGTYMLDLEAPIPGVPWTTFWLVIANSPT